MFMVYVRGKSSPTKEYTSEKEAVAEAQRLCAKEQGTTFVLQTVTQCEIIPNPVKTTDLR